jgi:predicted SprT family Zn-dependent metalloprotease
VVDFKKLLKERPERKEYLYRCKKCGQQDWYMTSLPPHMLVHDFDIKAYRFVSKCRGKLVLVEERKATP